MTRFFKELFCEEKMITVFFVILCRLKYYFVAH